MQQKTELKEQVFFCMDTGGYMAKIKPRNTVEKQQMYNSFSEFIQIGFRSQDNIKIQFSDNSTRIINPGLLRIGKRHFLAKIKKVQVFWLEPKIKNCEVEQNEQTNNGTKILQETSV